jgi:arsenite-transporting ATPase
MGRLLLFGGKGGVGKTTTAAATALWLADSGWNTLLVSSDPAHSTSDALGIQLSGDPELVEGIENLWGLELDPAQSMEAMLPKFSGAIGKMSGGGAMGMFLGTQGDDIKEELTDVEAGDLLLPGLDEALAFERLLTLAQDPRFDVIVFDTAPTGHTLRFLALPEILEGWAGRITRIARMTGGIRSMLFGSKDERALQEELDRFSNRVAHIRRVIEDEQVTTFTLVTIPEWMAVAETRRAEKLGEFGIHLGGVIVNRVTPDLDHEFIQSRRSIEQEHLAALTDHFDDLPVVQIPLKNRDIHGVDSLRELGEQLHGEHQAIAEGMTEVSVGSSIPMRMRRSIHVSERNGRTTIELSLPTAKAEEFTARLVSGNLILESNGKETKIELGLDYPDCTANPRYVDGILTVHISF